MLYFVFSVFYTTFALSFHIIIYIRKSKKQNRPLYQNEESNHIAAILLSCSTGMQAQTENGDNDDVITVKTKTEKQKKSKFLQVWRTISTACSISQCSDIYDAGYSMQLQG